MYMFSIMQEIFWFEHDVFAILVSFFSLLRPLKRIQLSRSVLYSLSECFLYDSKPKMLWDSFLILAVVSFYCVQKNVIVFSVVGLNLKSWMCLKPSLDEVGAD